MLEALAGNQQRTNIRSTTILYGVAYNKRSGKLSILEMKI
nr:MAG TPA: hypothetical protein [Caudoviricetes sp.]DAT91403.1 MAG TPA: hypothetical protein [Caudoviricetes sp.]